MTEVSFHFNIADRAQHLERLVRKVVREQRTMVVLCPNNSHAATRAQLHQAEPESFWGIATQNDPVEVVQRSAIVLSDTTEQMPHHDILVNCTRELVAGFERYDKLIELVDDNEADKQAARDRWRHYSHRGYTILRHDLSGK